MTNTAARCPVICGSDPQTFTVFVNDLQTGVNTAVRLCESIICGTQSVVVGGLVR